MGGGKERDSISLDGRVCAQEAHSLPSTVPLREFRRGMERANITCLTFSLDLCWLGCASDHGTVHIFQTHDPNSSNDSSSKPIIQKSKSSSMAGAMRMLPKIVVAPKKYLMDGEQSYAQVRGIPYPQACAFVPDRERTIAVAGVDEYGNGCLLLSEFGKCNHSGETKAPSKGDEEMDDSEARRLGYHRFFKKGGAAAMHSKSEGRRRRTKSKESKSLAELEDGGAFIDDNPVDLKMGNIQIGDENEDEFVPIDYNETNN